MENCAIEVLGFGGNIIQTKFVWYFDDVSFRILYGIFQENLYGILMMWVLEFSMVFSRKIL